MATKGHQQLNERLATIESRIKQVEQIGIYQHIKDIWRVIETQALSGSDYVLESNKQSFNIPVKEGETSSTNSVEYISGGTGYVKTQWSNGMTVVHLEENTTPGLRQFKIIQRVWDENKEYYNNEYLCTQKYSEEAMSTVLMAKGTPEYSFLIPDE